MPQDPVSQSSFKGCSGQAVWAIEKGINLLFVVVIPTSANEQKANQAEPAVLDDPCRASHLCGQHARVKAFKGMLHLACPATVPISIGIAQTWQAFNTENLCHLAGCPQNGCSEKPSPGTLPGPFCRKHLRIPPYLLVIPRAAQNLLCHLLV